MAKEYSVHTRWRAPSATMAVRGSSLRGRHRSAVAAACKATSQAGVAPVGYEGSVYMPQMPEPEVDMPRRM